MYFIELLIKKLRGVKKHKTDFVDLALNFEDEVCEHFFMPIDSTNEIFSCTKCGFIKNKKELKNKNFFDT